MEAGGNRGVGSDHPALELRRRQAARPAIEQLHRFGAGFDLAGEIFDRQSRRFASIIA